MYSIRVGHLLANAILNTYFLLRISISQIWQVPKGFIAIDGTSLTVCEVVDHDEEYGTGWFSFMLIEHTQNHVIMPHKPVGGKVNIEVDVMGKYVQRSLSSILARMTEIERVLSIKQSKGGYEGSSTAAQASASSTSSIEDRLSVLETKVSALQKEK